MRVTAKRPTSLIVYYRRPSGAFALVGLASIGLIGLAVWQLVAHGFDVAYALLCALGVVGCALALATPYGIVATFDKGSNRFEIAERAVFRRRKAEGALDAIEHVEVRRFVGRSGQDAGESAHYTVVLAMRHEMFESAKNLIVFRDKPPMVPGRGEPEWQAANRIAAFLGLKTPIDARNRSWNGKADSF